MELTVDGRSVFVATGGRMPDPNLDTVVFVHGVAQDHTIWVLPIRYFARHDRNVIAVDLPGHGRSAGPPLTKIEEMASWLTRVLDEFSLRTTAVVGHSMGSLVALEAGGRHADRVRAMVMVGVSVPLRVSDALMGAAQQKSSDTLDMLTYWGHSKRAQVGGNRTPGIWMTGAYMRLLERCPPKTIAADLAACDSYDGGMSAASEATAPALLLLGQRDIMTPVRGAGELIDSLSDGRTVIYEGAGHALLTERPEQILDALIDIV